MNGAASMNGVVLGASAGVVLALAGLAYGFWGVVLVAVLGAIGAVVGGAVTGRLDVRAAFRAARGRKVG
ncbi:DUF2273 domain-containing protein [Arenivirga flava]|uniref:DUF2273 domain-containing protein n=1 Tax=Arenivirga flava TaxID=1930060 RepID=A0AA37UM84_9MICO|nr:hypothetical protein GCM10025874_27840 [Arenivirga flava]